ncbi:hypothetical protein FACS189483_04080 [Spirochaetia bacterium]|nr:hypothetical protein FACS189483_04080 [Spirochaetia bacterium]
MIVYMGIDFGTSYSKVCFSSIATEKIDIIFDENNDEYKHSVLYYLRDWNTLKGRLYYKKPAVVTSPVYYFKYSMINESLPKNMDMHDEKIITNNHEMLCSLCFLAWLIKDSKRYIATHYKKFGMKEEIDYRITMGVPIENYNDENKKIYDNILYIADKLSDSDLISLNYIDLDVLDKYFQENWRSNTTNFKLNTLPELYAEAIAFFNNPNYNDGLYGVVDIGGGTVDIAVLKKENFDGRQMFSILCQSIKPCGIEILISELSGKNILLEKASNYLLKLDIDLKDDAFEAKYNKIFGESFRKMTLDAKRKVVSNFWNKAYHIVLCGGGSIYKWYQRIIQDSRSLLSPAGIKYNMDISEKFFKENRLIISRALAQPYFNLPKIEGFPWNIEEIKQIYKSEDPNDNAIRIYGKPL